MPTIAELAERFRHLEPMAMAITALAGRTPGLADRIKLEELAIQFNALGSDINLALPVVGAIAPRTPLSIWQVLEECRVQAALGNLPETWEANLAKWYGLDHP